MSFYDHTKEDRVKLVEKINIEILSDIKKNKLTKTVEYFSDEDTYIRKSAYKAIGKIYNDNPNIQTIIISTLDKLLTVKVPKIRQTTINAAGEIGIKRI